jgi:hypothetical protein
MLAVVPGARAKRTLLSLLGRRDAALQAQLGFPGNEWLAGVTDPPCVKNPAFLTRWLGHLPGQTVELTCHPGHPDPSLLDRDANVADGQLQRRVDEFHLLSQLSFQVSCQHAGLTRIAPRDWLISSRRGAAHAA